MALRPDHQKAGNCYSDRKSTRLNSSHLVISYAVFCLKKKKNKSEHHSTANILCSLMIGKPHHWSTNPPHTTIPCKHSSVTTPVSHTSIFCLTKAYHQS